MDDVREPEQGDRLPSQMVASAVRRLIKDERMRPGDKLPSERELSRQFGVARNTAREGIRQLVVEGLVMARHGSGNFVREQQRLFRWGNERYSRRTFQETGLTPFRLEMQRQGRAARIDVVSITRLAPPQEVADGLRVPADDESVVRRENHYYADDEPVQVVITYVRWADAEGTALLEPKAGVGGIYGRLEDKGHVMTSGQDDVIARMPTREETKFFKFPPSTPVLEVVHTSYDQDGEPFEMSWFVHRGDRHGLRYTFGVD